MSQGAKTFLAPRAACRFAVSVVLVYALFIRLLIPLALARATLFDDLLAGPHALCVSGSSADDPAQDNAPLRHDHCDDCGLCAARTALMAPPQTLGIVIVSAVALSSTAPFAPHLPRGPPAEAWSMERTQRGPPLI